ncbi:2-oxoglutarate dehydrogenase complex dihydrolipoyllysine-residue succinyltransferase [Prosthecomicrobium pneumaticum]|uniref:Dihydrolipoyllysine-residue succinyltransferase component of 2-oxoglutarate dehydrogenase complex n=1 Tax=Prosthecomicrobium pneumaticum TaxID=81895 RepID=A0A7W9FMY2_9HYPH|nr:2-oxoglutarate dehydrogenase complex dihydrolipoyllysine-residue succinyltransferase [Prosthecomicrobium pneumaticum]MBB5753614.1 2-oxoglutarate dehydrogenase E2 component (dihydrolipoamide succinyltransferase) [Prosthecomicrobium pneumaticum]
MATEIRVPTLGESVTEATIGRWFKKVGEAVAVDEPLVELETDKVTIEVPAPAAGTIEAIAAKDGETVGVGALLGTIAAAGAGAAKADVNTAAKPELSVAQASGAGASTSAPATAGAEGKVIGGPEAIEPRGNGPAVDRIAAENRIDPAAVAGSGKDGRVTKGDMLAAVAAGGAQAAAPAPAAAPAAAVAAVAPVAPAAPAPAAPRAPAAPDDASREERVRMTKLRQTIARRLKDAQNTAAMLTTFNEVDMGAVMALRNQYKDLFEKKHGVKLGFMSFFTKAVIQALKEIPAVNAEIDGTDLVYKNYYHIGIAVGTDKGLVVPVVRDADRLSLAGIEKTIAGLGKRARDGQLKIEEMQGGTFTITNGGIYGSLMSTPILNAPQSGILGMHKIQERPMVVGGKIEVRPMMYLALSYDHRIVDGKEAVTFLVRVKESLEDPQRLVLDL